MGAGCSSNNSKTAPRGGEGGRGKGGGGGNNGANNSTNAMTGNRTTRTLVGGGASDFHDMELVSRMEDSATNPFASIDNRNANRHQHSGAESSTPDNRTGNPLASSGDQTGTNSGSNSRVLGKDSGNNSSKSNPNPPAVAPGLLGNSNSNHNASSSPHKVGPLDPQQSRDGYALEDQNDRGGVKKSDAKQLTETDGVTTEGVTGTADSSAVAADIKYSSWMKLDDGLKDLDAIDKIMTAVEEEEAHHDEDVQEFSFIHKWLKVVNDAGAPPPAGVSDCA